MTNKLIKGLGALKVFTALFILILLRVSNAALASTPQLNSAEINMKLGYFVG